MTKLGIVFRFHLSYNRIQEKTKISQNLNSLRKMSKKVLTFQKKRNILITEHVFGIRKVRGGILMTNKEMELIKMIRENDNPTQALMTAIIIVQGYLRQHELDSTQGSVGLRESS